MVIYCIKNTIKNTFTNSENNQTNMNAYIMLLKSYRICYNKIVSS